MDIDWIATALNAHAPIASSNQIMADGCLPNFDQFLGNNNNNNGNNNTSNGDGNNSNGGGQQQQQQQQPLDFTARHRPFDFNTTITDITGPLPINIVIKGSSQGSGIIQQEEQQQQSMQRYLNGLMQNNTNTNTNPNPNNSNNNNNNSILSQQQLSNNFAKLLPGNNTNTMVAKPSSSSAYMNDKMAQSMLMGNNTTTTTTTTTNKSPSPTGIAPPPAASPNHPPPFNATTGSSVRETSRQKNDKAVEVHHNHKVIARFRTQTECARYLRATPEAVSYHCSKGGGICNSLVIRPLTSDQVETDSQNPQLMTPFGLFEGAVAHRPKERPQLRPETVATLKDWLLSPQHVDNPYPNQRESEHLMKKTGLDKTQLKHWFNNARKRILKPLLKNGGKVGLAKAKAEAAAGVLAAGGQPMGMGGEDDDVDETFDIVDDAPGHGPSCHAGFPTSSAAGNKKREGKNKKFGPSKKKRKSDNGDTASSSGSSSSKKKKNEKQPLSINSSSSTHKMSTNLSNNGSSSSTSAQQRRNRMAQQNFDENFQRQTSSQDHSSRSGTNASMMMMNGQNINYNGGYGMNVNSMNHHRGGNMMNMGMGMHSAMMMNSSRNFPQDSNNNMFSNNDMDGMMMMNSSRMMGGGGGSNGMRFNSYNDSSSRGSSMNDNFGGGGGYQGSGNGMGGGFNGCMEGGGNATNNNGPSRFNNDNYDSNSMGHRGGGRGANQQGGGYPQDSNQGYDRFNSNGSDEYCQPLSSQGQQNHPQGVGQQGDPRIPSSAGGGNSGGGGGSPGGGQDTPDDSARSNAVFKQQVATMAMNEASTAFKDMEDAFAHAKSVMAQSREAHPEDDPCVIQANAHAKKCQSVAMFKLKVSQRASEEAAGAYESYQTMVGGSPGGGNSPVPLMGGRGLMGGGRDFSR